MNEQLIEDVLVGPRQNSHQYSLNEKGNLWILNKNNQSLLDNNMPFSFLPIPISNEEILQVNNVKPKIQHWVWIMVIISILLLTSGIGAISYEMYRRSSHSNIINTNQVIKDKNKNVLKYKK